MTVLWVFVLLALMAASFSLVPNTEVNLIRKIVEKAEALADAGVRRAILAVLTGEAAPRFGTELDDLLKRRRDLEAVLLECPEFHILEKPVTASRSSP